MILLCEGGEGSPDVRILAEILRDLPIELRPSQSRGHLLREADGVDVLALRDGDFPPDPHHPPRGPGPRPLLREGRWCGFLWVRKEIENYLLDPEVLARSFGWWPGSEKERDYPAFLDELLRDCAERTAARMALLDLLPRYERRVVRLIDPALAGAALEADLRERHRRSEGRARRSEAALIERFHALLPLCHPGGPCFHPWVMAGKDLLGAVARQPGVRERFPELIDAGLLVDEVVRALRLDPAPWSWLEEWRLLREALQARLQPESPANKAESEAWKSGSSST